MIVCEPGVTADSYMLTLLLAETENWGVHNIQNLLFDIQGSPEILAKSKDDKTLTSFNKLVAY